MKKTTVKFAITLGLISSTLFISSCSKKSDDPKPIVVNQTITTPTTNKTCDTCFVPNNKRYVFDNDTALAFIAKWNNKTIKCVNANFISPTDTFSITMTKIVSHWFDSEYEGHNVLEINMTLTNYYGIYSSIDYLAFNQNTFIQSIPILNTHVSPWLINPEKSGFDFTIIDSKTINFNSSEDTHGEGYRIVN